MSHALSDADLNRIYAALASEAGPGITQAGRQFRAAGLVPSGDQQHWATLMQSLDPQFRRFSPDEKLRTMRVLVQQLMDENAPERRDRVARLLSDHGFQYVGGSFVPIEFFDQREARYLPESALSEISTALGRLVDNDRDGALAAACSAVETATADVYRKKSLGDPASEDSFQKKAMTAISACAKLSALEAELVSLGWDPKDADLLRKSQRRDLTRARSRVPEKSQDTIFALRPKRIRVWEAAACRVPFSPDRAA
jgi:hypothetical protein